MSMCTCVKLDLCSVRSVQRLPCPCDMESVSCLSWLFDEYLCATPGLLRGQAEPCCTSTTRGCNEPKVNSVFPERKCDGIWEEHLLLVSRRLQRTTRVRQGSSPRRLASTSSTAWMTWRRYAVTLDQYWTIDALFDRDTLTFACLEYEDSIDEAIRVPGKFDPSHPENYLSNIWGVFKYLSCRGLIPRCCVALLPYRILLSEMKAAVRWNPSSTQPQPSLCSSFCLTATE